MLAKVRIAPHINAVNSDLQISVYVLITFFSILSVSILYSCFVLLQKYPWFHRDGEVVLKKEKKNQHSRHLIV